MSYDGFISYSHAADDLLAPRLQTGLQRFAKPWWQRRAMRVFRDESSLSANPHLWSSITEALDSSGWFVLLLSPDAAQSEWVNQEVAYWVEHKDPSRILPVVTAGEFGWADGDVTGDAVPDALRGVFAEEPRWVDMRWAREEDQLDLQDPRFADAVADIASAIRGVPKDDLAGEEVRQHRRTVRTAWAAGAALVALAVAAVGFGIQSAQNAEQAEASAAESERQAALAQENADEADASTRRLLDYVIQEVNVAGSVDIPGAGAVSEDVRVAVLPVSDVPPSSTRLDFLQEICSDRATDLQTPTPAAGGGCFRWGHFVDPTRAIRIPAWVSGEAFHIRHGFPNATSEGIESRSRRGFEVRLYITRVAGPDVPEGFEVGETRLFYPDYVIREQSLRCGPIHAQQTQSVLCDRFVHDFPDGLPPGTYEFWLDWYAPCSWWVGADRCESPELVLNLFSAASQGPFFGESYLPPVGLGYDRGVYTWPIDVWDYAEPIPDDQVDSP